MSDEKKYKSSQALESAMKDMARNSKTDTSMAIEAFYRQRLLARVFGGGDSPFVLKGGQAMLARTPAARVSRDVDLVEYGTSREEALEELLRRIKEDTGDFVSFDPISITEIKTRDPAREGYKVLLQVSIGSKQVQRLPIDIVADSSPSPSIELVWPSDALEVSGLEIFAYRVYTVTKAISDKVCAIIERHDGRPSSRVKDLVDIGIYAKSVDFRLHPLRSDLDHELETRGIEKPPEFEVPSEWVGFREPQYEKIASQGGYAQEVPTMEAATKLAKKVVDPALADADQGDLTWDHGKECWAAPNDTPSGGGIDPPGGGGSTGPGQDGPNRN